ncbi:MADS-box transcription factor PHERES 1-like [Aegilops tauschii subsp. strangulata]|uniref:MADS-box domain-containing protein n=2 Tax=Aegilops tauschii TaxID=37682 RepID=A0A453PWR8_AEGTS|nr:agamous-like MADS-box protein AGL80 [Aegilops tauschii subsp. strangulata]
MARKKIALQYIKNKSSRRRTLDTRMKNLASKARELSILCNAKACVLVYDEGNAAPKVYPSHAEAADLLNRYRTMAEGRFKKTVNQEDFLSQRLSKLQVEENKVRDPEIRILLHKAMLGSDLPDLKVDELTIVSSRLEEILKSMGESIAKISGQPPVLQPQVPYIPDNVDMGGSSAMYQASQPAPYVTNNMDMGPFAMNQQPSPTPYVTGSMHVGSPMMYQVPPQHEGWLDKVRSGRDLDALAHNSYNCAGHDGANTSTGAGYSTNGHDGAGTSANAGSSGGMKSLDVGFGWQSGGVDPEESSWSLFPPM